jgi:hypothetical protein
MTTEDKAPKSKADAKSGNGIGRKKGAGTGLNDLFLAVFGVGFVLSLSMNVMHMMGQFDVDGRDVLLDSTGRTKMAKVHDGSAIHKAMRDFKSHSVKTKRNNDETMTTQGRNAQHAEFVGEEHNTHDFPPEMGMDNHDEDEESDDEDEGSDDDEVDGNDDDLMELATLDCTAYGGPSKQDAQEMVYWQEIPSDSLYVSPFFKTGQQQASHIKYLTFEPDGGGWYVSR